MKSSERRRSPEGVGGGSSEPGAAAITGTSMVTSASRDRAET